MKRMNMKRIAVTVISVVVVAFLLIGFVPMGGFLSGISGFALPLFNAQERGWIGDSIFWSFDGENGVLNITGTGDIPNYDWPNTPPWAEVFSAYVDSIAPGYGTYNRPYVYINIEEGITGIGHNAFSTLQGSSEGWPSTNVFTIPRSVIRIEGDSGLVGYFSHINTIRCYPHSFAHVPNNLNATIELIDD
jgi:hypothetical protein